MSGFKISNNDIDEMFKSAEKTAVIDEDVVVSDPVVNDNSVLEENENVVNEHEHTNSVSSDNNADNGDNSNDDSSITSNEIVSPVVSGISKNTVNKIITLADNIDSLGDQGKSIISIMLVKKKIDDEEINDKVDTVFELANSSSDNVRHAKFFIETINVEDRVDRVFKLLEIDNNDLSGVGEIVALLMGSEISGVDSKELTRNIESSMESFYQEYNDFFKKYTEIIKEIVNSLHSE